MTHTATDGNGNESRFYLTDHSLTQLISCVVDNTPLINCPPNIYKTTNAFTGGAGCLGCTGTYLICVASLPFQEVVSGNVSPCDHQCGLQC
ncbi:MAG: hypothetical protein R2788_11045 [Saprospiraceae bacterium]